MLKLVDVCRKVKQGGKSSSIDGESWEAFDKKLEDNLYIIRNRLASGTYHSSAVREVEISKKHGKTRKLDTPTLRDPHSTGSSKEDNGTVHRSTLLLKKISEIANL